MSIANIEQLLAGCKGLSVTDSQQLYGAGDADFPLLLIETDLCRAVIALQGAQLIEFKARNGGPLLWLSPQTAFQRGKAIRGGIPVCFPWFGPHPSDKDKPQHGFARIREWSVEHAFIDAQGNCRIALSLAADDFSQPLFPFEFLLELHCRLGENAELAIHVTNTDKNPFAVSWALHSYHPVTSLPDTLVHGLSGLCYRDNTDNLKLKTQHGAVHFGAEVDRVYENVPLQQSIEAETRIAIRGENCETAIVWNPGPEKAVKIADIGAGNHQHFICVERGAAFDNTWQVAPGQTQTGKLWIEQA